TPSPQSYTHPSPLTFTQIKPSHHPATSPTVTPIIILSIPHTETNKNNAFTAVMENDMVRAFDVLDRDERVRVIVITGAGRNFCAGAGLEVGS
ncbi:hypothetical protein BKA65DRAFT_394796, partial [Rhexocercosporidium sp. MPI-PUGE-AT-0058]